MRTDPQAKIEQLMSIGVEEEFVLVDARTRYTAPCARDVLDKVQDTLPDRIHAELYAAQVETNTDPQISLAALRRDLHEARQVVATAARDVGCRLVAAGSGILTTGSPPITADPRYERMVGQYANVLNAIESEPSGCHIHLGTIDRTEALALSTRLRPWLPVLQALASNSPFAAGQDRGCASRRHFQQLKWPAVGPAPVTDEAGYDRRAAEMLAAGTILDRKMIAWYARPSEHLPTLEVRVADVNADLDVTLLIAGLLRGLATTMLAEIRTGHPGDPGPEISQRQLREAHAAAAQDGFHAVLPDLGSGAEPVRTALQRMIEHSLPGLRAADDVDEVRLLANRLAELGTGADRQRTVHQRRGSLSDVVDSLVV